MNYFAVLDESDNEDVQKKNNKANAKAPAAAAKTDAAPKAQTTGKPQQKDGKQVKDVKPAKTEGKTEGADAEASKEGARNGKPRNKDFRHGEGLRGERKNQAEARDVGKTRAKREFDRRSSTGRGREVSRGGRGAFGAGSAAQDALDAEKDPKAAEVAAEGAEAVEEEQPAAEEPVVEEPPSLSFADFLAQRNQSRAKVAGINERPIRAVSDADFAGLVAVENRISSEDAAKAAQAQKKEQRSTGRSELTEVSFKFQEIRVDSRERDSRERGPRTNGDRDSRRPRTEGDRDVRRPRPEGDRDNRRPRPEGDRDSRRPRPEGGDRAPRKTDKSPNQRGGKSAAAGAVFNAADFPSL